MDDRNKVISIEQINAQYGKIPPNAVDVEKVILAACMLERDAYSKINSIIKPESFYKEEHQLIFSVIAWLTENERPIDLMQVTQRLKDTELLDLIGGVSYIMEINRNIASAAHIEFHAKIIEQKYIQRELIRLTLEVQTKAYDDSIDVSDTISFLMDQINQVQTTPINQLKVSSEVIEEVYERIKQNLESTSEITGYAFGIEELDRFTGGGQKSDLVVIAAESGQGKTNLLMTILNNISRDGEPVGIISLEMSSLQLFSRIISQETNIPGKSILINKLNPTQIAEIDEVRESLSLRKIYVDDSSYKTLDSILNTMRYLFHKFDVRIFGIDYIQLIAVIGKSTREEKIANITRSFKNIAKELDILVIALSQLSRETSRNDRKPTKERLRGSGQIEEAADMILFVWRPEEYDQDFFEDGESTNGKAMIILAKGRNVGTMSTITRFDKNTGKFFVESLDDIDNPELPLFPDQFIESSFDKEKSDDLS